MLWRNRAFTGNCGLQKLLSVPFFPEGTKSDSGEHFKGQPVGCSGTWNYAIHCEN